MTKRVRKITAGISALAMVFCMGGYFPTLPAFQPTQSISMTAKAAEYQFEQVVGDYTAWVIQDGEEYTGVSLGRYTGTDTAVTIPSSVKVTIDEKEVTLPVTELHERVFRDQSNITAVTIPNSIKIVRESAFYGTSIKEIVFPEGVERIEWDVLACCPNLTSVSLPSTLKYLGEDDEAFRIKATIYSIRSNFQTTYDSSYNQTLCFIATYAFYDKPWIINDFRWFRREYLLNNKLGREINSLYVCLSSRVTKALRKNNLIREFFKIILYISVSYRI